MASNRQVIAVPWQYRWQVYYRLSRLGISCWYAPYQPLYGEITTPLAAIQVWSVVQQITASRQSLVYWLNDCWNQSCLSSDR